MKKILVVVVAIVVCLAFLFGLLWGIRGLFLLLLRKKLTPQDWCIPFPNDYSIWRINSKEIVLVKTPPSGGSSTVVSDYITAYCSDTRYIGLWCAKDGPGDLLGAAPEKDRFYLVDTRQDLLYGPFAPSEYSQVCKESGFSAFEDWIKTGPRVPEAALDQ